MEKKEKKTKQKQQQTNKQESVYDTVPTFLLKTKVNTECHGALVTLSVVSKATTFKDAHPSHSQLLNCIQIFCSNLQYFKIVPLPICMSNSTGNCYFGINSTSKIIEIARGEAEYYL